MDASEQKAFIATARPGRGTSENHLDTGLTTPPGNPL